MIDTSQILWLAGLMEGEGSFGLDLRETTRGDKTYSYWKLKVQLSMTDQDVVERARKVSGGLGKIYNKKPAKVGYKPQFFWSIYRQDEAYALMIALLPFMGDRRSETIREAITSWLSVKPKRVRNQCPQGHKYSDENTFVDQAGYRRCRACARDRNRKEKL